MSFFVSSKDGGDSPLCTVIHFFNKRINLYSAVGEPHKQINYLLNSFRDNMKPVNNLEIEHDLIYQMESLGTLHRHVNYIFTRKDKPLSSDLVKEEHNSGNPGTDMSLRMSYIQEIFQGLMDKLKSRLYDIELSEKTESRLYEIYSSYDKIIITYDHEGFSPPGLTIRGKAIWGVIYEKNSTKIINPTDKICLFDLNAFKRWYQVNKKVFIP